jgi:hypothetical protein
MGNSLLCEFADRWVAKGYNGRLKECDECLSTLSLSEFRCDYCLALYHIPTLEAVKRLDKKWALLNWHSDNPVNREIAKLIGWGLIDVLS